MNDAELKAIMARLDAEEAAGIVCPCYKCTLERTRLYPALPKKPKTKRAPGPKKQTDADLHAEHGS